MTVKEQSEFSKGLEDVVAAESSICAIDGKASKLFYRGYEIHDLAELSNFEETAYLLLFGALPMKEQLSAFRARLAAERKAPSEVFDFFARLPKGANSMAALRTAMSLLSFYDREADDKSREANERKAFRLIARTPAVVAGFERIRRGEKPVDPSADPNVSIAADFLRMMKGKDASPVEAKMLDKYFVLLAEHDLNASTFAAVITVATLSDMYSGVTSAVGTLKGELHGYANSRAMETILEIADAANVDAYVDRAISEKKKLMGFGHRVYKGPDPRAYDLRIMARTLAESNREQAKWFAISEKLEKAVYDRKKLSPNVDFYSASVLYTVGIPVDLFTPMFAISRMAGWTAHMIEQLSDNRLIRPVSHYVGRADLRYVPIEERR